MSAPSSLLQGLQVVDASRILAGPFCTQLLADLGAEVIKIERPGQGDDTRDWGPPFQAGQSAYFISCNRNKKSVTLNLQDARGRAVLHQLLQRAKVFVENFRTDTLQKHDLTPEKLLEVHPHLVICSISGFGRSGPKSDEPGYDFAIQALSGLMNVTGPPEGPPYKVGVALIDVLTGHYAASAILAALIHQAQTGKGSIIDLALADVGLASQVNVAQAYLCSGQQPSRPGNAHLQIVPYRLFATADGWLVVNVGNDQQWQKLCHLLEKPEWITDPRFAHNSDRVTHRQELEPWLEELFQKEVTNIWDQRLQSAGIPCARVRDYQEIFQDEQYLHRQMLQTVNGPEGTTLQLLGTPVKVLTETGTSPASAPPALGEHTREILTRLNYSAAEIALLQSQGVL